MEEMRFEKNLGISIYMRVLRFAINLISLSRLINITGDDNEINSDETAQQVYNADDTSLTIFCNF